MIPDLAVVVCAYAIYRILDILLAGSSKYSSKAAYIISVVLGIGAIMVIVWAGMDVISIGSSTSLGTH